MAESPPSGASDAPAETAAVRIRPWSSLAIPQYRLLFAGITTSTVAMQMREVTNLWMVWELSGSAMQLGLLGVFRFVPSIVLGLFGGTVADMVERRKLLLVTQTTNFLLASSLAVLALTGQIEVWHIYAVATGSAAVGRFGQPAQMSLIPSLVPRTHLTNAITLNMTSRHSSRLFGPSLAGLIIAWQGAGVAYGINALGILPLLGALLVMRPPPTTRSRRPQLNLTDMLAGLRFIWSTHVIVAFIALDTSAMVFTSYRTLMPIFAEEVLGVGATGFGMLMSAPAFGFLIGSGLLLAAGDFKRKGVVVMAATALYAVAVALFAVSHWFLLSLALIAAVGALDAVGTVIRQTVLQFMVPDEVRGRATAGLQMFTGGSPALGQALTGGVASVLGAPGALLVGAGACAVAVTAVGVKLRDVLTYRG